MLLWGSSMSGQLQVKLEALEHRVAYVCAAAWPWLAEVLPGAVIGLWVLPAVPLCHWDHWSRSKLNALQHFLDDCAQLWMCSWQPCLEVDALGRHIRCRILGRPAVIPVPDPALAHTLGQLCMDDCTCDWAAVASARGGRLGCKGSFYIGAG